MPIFIRNFEGSNPYEKKIVKSIVRKKFLQELFNNVSDKVSDYVNFVLQSMDLNWTQNAQNILNMASAVPEGFFSYESVIMLGLSACNAAERISDASLSGKKVDHLYLNSTA